jgi:hypothetical protein
VAFKTATVSDLWRNSCPKGSERMSVRGKRRGRKKTKRKSPLVYTLDRYQNLLCVWTWSRTRCTRTHIQIIHVHSISKWYTVMCRGGLSTCTLRIVHRRYFPNESVGLLLAWGGGGRPGMYDGTHQCWGSCCVERPAMRNGKRSLINKILYLSQVSPYTTCTKTDIISWWSCSVAVYES